MNADFVTSYETPRLIGQRRRGLSEYQLQVLMWYIEGKALDEIALILGKTYRAINSQLFVAMQKMKTTVRTGLPLDAFLQDIVRIKQ